MKIIKFLAAGVISLAAVTGNAAQILEATDGDVNFTSDSLDGYSLYLFDDDDAGNIGTSAVGLEVALAATSFGDTSGTVTIEEVGSGYNAYNFSSPLAFIALTDDPWFVLAITDNSNWYVGELDVFDSNSFRVRVKFPGVDGVKAISIDVQPVPLPATAWLFGAALLGFAGVSRRTKA